MAERPGPILVVGATGNQGGAAVRYLLEQGWEVRALTRNPELKPAIELRDLGAELRRGDFSDRASLEQALNGIYGVFLPSIQVNMRVTPDTETVYGLALLDAARDAGIRHLVYASEMGANPHSSLGYLASKGRIEARIRELGLPATILRHAFFLDWLEGRSASTVWLGLERGLKKGQNLQVITVDDIGGIATLVFNQPERFIGQEMDLAGDEASLDQISRAYRQVKGVNLKSTWIPFGLLTRMGAFGEFVENLPAQESRADIVSLRALYPALKNLEQGLMAIKPMTYPSAQRKAAKS